MWFLRRLGCRITHWRFCIRWFRDLKDIMMSRFYENAFVLLFYGAYMDKRNAIIFNDALPSLSSSSWGHGFHSSIAMGLGYESFWWCCHFRYSLGLAGCTSLVFPSLLLFLWSLSSPSVLSFLFNKTSFIQKKMHREYEF